MRALIFYSVLQATSATRIATIPPPKNASSLPDYVGCVNKSPELSLAIWNFCNQPNLTVPSTFASRFDYGNITMGIEASCKPPKVLQESTCRDRFFDMCNGSSDDTIKILKTFGNSGCQNWIIHRGAAVNGTTPGVNGTVSSTSMSTTSSVHGSSSTSTDSVHETKSSSTSISMSTTSSVHKTTSGSTSTSTPASVHKTVDTSTGVSMTSSAHETTSAASSIHGTTSTSVPESTSSQVLGNATASTHERKITGRPSHLHSNHEHASASVRGESKHRQSASTRLIHSHARQL